MINESKTNGVSLDALKGMQSVRATFTLPKQSIDLLSVVSSQLGVKQKSIFDHLVEDEKRLGRIADQAQKYRTEEKKRRQKTFVLSKNSLSTLEALARTHKLPRDVLVEYFIRQLRPVVDAEKKRHENRKVLLREMQKVGEKGRELTETARQLVGEDDTLCQGINTVMTLFNRQIKDLEVMIRKGQCMEEL